MMEMIYWVWWVRCPTTAVPPTHLMHSSWWKRMYSWTEMVQQHISLSSICLQQPMSLKSICLFRILGPWSWILYKVVSKFIYFFYNIFILLFLQVMFETLLMWLSSSQMVNRMMRLRHGRRRVSWGSVVSTWWLWGWGRSRTQTSCVVWRASLPHLTCTELMTSPISPELPIILEWQCAMVC